MDFIKRKNISFTFSVVYIVLGLVLFFTRGLNLDIDFTGGTMIEMTTPKFISDQEVMELTKAVDSGMHITHAGEDNTTLVLKTSKNLSVDELNALKQSFVDKYEVSSDSIGSRTFEASMGSEIKQKALLSVLVSIIGILIYTSIRFKLDYGIAAVIAIFHDILFMLATYSIFRIPVNSSFIAAILTVLGYSINDTIVIFDRIRENLKLHHEKNVYDIVNMSISQSMARTINTSVTTVVAVGILFVLGVSEVRILALPLMVGTVVGTYSTIFIASAFWYLLHTKDQKLPVSKKVRTR